MLRWRGKHVFNPTNLAIVALLPTVVVQDELRSGHLVEYGVVPDLHENFYAISVQRHFSPPLLKALLKQSEAEVLGSRAG